MYNNMTYLSLIQYKDLNFYQLKHPTDLRPVYNEFDWMLSQESVLLTE